MLTTAILCNKIIFKTGMTSQFHHIVIEGCLGNSISATNIYEPGRGPVSV